MLFSMCIVEVLEDGVVLVNIPGWLDLDVQLVAIHPVGDGVAQVLQLTIYPRKWVATEHKSW